jgi:hypothetical protein
LLMFIAALLRLVAASDAAQDSAPTGARNRSPKDAGEPPRGVEAPSRRCRTMGKTRKADTKRRGSLNNVSKLRSEAQARRPAHRSICPVSLKQEAACRPRVSWFLPAKRTGIPWGRLRVAERAPLDHRSHHVATDGALAASIRAIPPGGSSRSRARGIRRCWRRQPAAGVTVPGGSGSDWIRRRIVDVDPYVVERIGTIPDLLLDKFKSPPDIADRVAGRHVWPALPRRCSVVDEVRR